MKNKLLLGALAFALAGCDSLPSIPGFGGSDKPVRSRSASHDYARPVAHKDMVSGLLAYDRELRRMSDADISREQARAGGDRSVYGSMRLGLALMRGRSEAEVARAQSVFEGIGAPADAETRGLAQLLAATCAELRRLYDQNDQLAVQLRESKRRSDQLSDMVDGLKNIERTLPTRSAPRPPPGAGK